MAKANWKEDALRQIQTDEQRDKAVEDARKKEDELVERLRELQAEYDAAHPKKQEDLNALFPNSGATREKSFDALESDSDIVAAAKRSAAEQRAAKKDKAERAYAAKERKLSDERRESEKKREENIRALRSLFDENMDDARDRALKNGTARGSILSGETERLAEAREEGENRINSEYRDLMNALDSEYAELQRKKSVDMNEIDAQVDKDAEEQISKLKAERDKKLREYEKYNESAHKTNEKSARAREDAMDEYLLDKRRDELDEEKSSDAYMGDKGENYKRRFDLAAEFYGSLDPSFAYDALNASTNMRYYLGDYYFKKLADMLKKQYTADMGIII